jgi:hypothetical protein
VKGGHATLLRVHKILVVSALALGLLMVAWGARALVRHEPGGLEVALIGALALVAGSLYLRKILRSPPI